MDIIEIGWGEEDEPDMEVEEAVALSLSAQPGEALPLPSLSTQEHNEISHPASCFHSPIYVSSQRRPFSSLAGRVRW
jgi:hypothetical protein